MTGRAVVIKTAGNPEIAGAIVDGISKNIVPLSADELEVVRREYERLEAEYKMLQAEYGVMKPRDSKYWQAQIDKLNAEDDSGNVKKLRNTLTLVWAIVWTMCDEWFHFLQDWNREG